MVLGANFGTKFGANFVDFPVVLPGGFVAKSHPRSSLGILALSTVRGTGAFACPAEYLSAPLSNTGVDMGTWEPSVRNKVQNRG